MPLAFVRQPNLAGAGSLLKVDSSTGSMVQTRGYVKSMSEIDAATHETAATLVGVASFGKLQATRREASDSSNGPDTDNRNLCWERPAPGVGSTTNVGTSSASGTRTAGTTTGTGSAASATQAPAPAPDHHSSPVMSSSSPSPWGGASTAPAHSSAVVTPSASNAQIIMSSIGFGIDPSMSTWGDATEAAVRALRDAMERSAISLPTAPHLRGDVRIQVKIGVPPRHPGQVDPMKVDAHRLTTLLPQTVTLLPIQVVVGGLLISSESALPRNIAHIAAPSHPTICTAVACVTLQQHSVMLQHQHQHHQHQVVQQQQHSAVTTSAATHSHSLSSHSHSRSHAPTHSSPAPAAHQHVVTAAAAAHRSPWSSLEQPSSSQAQAQAQAQLLPPLQVPSPVQSQHHHQQQQTSASLQNHHQTSTSAALQQQQQSIQQQHAASIQQQQQHPHQHHHTKLAQSSQPAPAPAKTIPKSNPSEHLQHQHQHQHHGQPPKSVLQMEHHQHQHHHQETAASISSAAPSATATGGTTTASSSTSTVPDPRKVYTRGNSMEMLAMISEELHERSMSNASEESIHGFLDGDASRNATSGYNYKKLPPGVTPKNNKRLFVKHNYRDHSSEEPLPEEMYLVERSVATVVGGSAAVTIPATRTPNAAFPLKLHETLLQIEQDGYGNIVGWLPHGRSFKIHEQKEFVEVILPKYFVMTKKSSFLRQLNLYGFNRLSGVGPDQGSYYHEKFLRGMKFLCRRMTRQKVNGNGIRAAGNPDEEPVLSRYPVCPPPGGKSTTSSLLITSPTTTSSSSAAAAVVAAAAAASASGMSPSLSSRISSSAPSKMLMSSSIGVGASASASVSVKSSSNNTTYPDLREEDDEGMTKEMKTITTAAYTGEESLGDSSYHRQSPLTSNSRAVSGDSSTLVPTLALGARTSSTTSSNSGGDRVDRDRSGGAGGGGGIFQVSFPLKLQRILDKLDSEGKTDIISWLPHGRAFLVHNSDRFVVELMPIYFNQTKFSSFQRQLHMYNFQRITAGRDKGAYHHPNFQRGKPQLCLKMVRTRVNGKGCRRPGNPNSEPNLYAMGALPPIARGTKIEIPVEMPPTTTTATSVTTTSDNNNSETNNMTGATSGDEV